MISLSRTVLVGHEPTPTRAAAPRIPSMALPHRFPTDAIGGSGGRAVGSAGAVDDLSMGGAKLSNSAHDSQDMSANGTLLHGHTEKKPTRRSAANQQRRRHDSGLAHAFGRAVAEKDKQMGLVPSLDIKNLHDTQADNEGLGAGGEGTGAGNERAGDGNAIAGAGIACAGGCTIAGIAWAGGYGPVPYGTPPAPSPYNLGDGGGRPSQFPADALDHQFALGPVLTRLLRSIGHSLTANMSLLLHIAVRIVQEILQGERSRRSAEQGESAVPV